MRREIHGVNKQKAMYSFERNALSDYRARALESINEMTNPEIFATLNLPLLEEDINGVSP